MNIFSRTNQSAGIIATFAIIFLSVFFVFLAPKSYAVGEGENCHVSPSVGLVCDNGLICDPIRRTGASGYGTCKTPEEIQGSSTTGSTAARPGSGDPVRQEGEYCNETSYRPSDGTFCGTNLKCELIGRGGTGGWGVCSPFKAKSQTSGPLDPTGECPGEQIDTALGCIPFNTDEFVPALLRFIIGFAGLAALVIMIIGSIVVITGGSNPEQVQKGKELFTSAIVGLLFIIFSVVILRIVAADIIQLPQFLPGN